MSDTLISQAQRAELAVENNVVVFDPNAPRGVFTPGLLQAIIGALYQQTEGRPLTHLWLPTEAPFTLDTADILAYLGVQVAKWGVEEFSEANGIFIQHGIAPMLAIESEFLNHEHDDKFLCIAASIEMDVDNYSKASYILGSY